VENYNRRRSIFLSSFIENKNLNKDKPGKPKHL